MLSTEKAMNIWKEMCRKWMMCHPIDYDGGSMPQVICISDVFSERYICDGNPPTYL